MDVSGLSVSITPSSTSSKILVLITLGGVANSGANTESFRVFRGATWIAQPAVVGGNGAGSFVSWCTTYAPTASFSYLDSPATTSATTYKVQGSISGGAGTTYVNRRGADTASGQSSTIILMEIKG